MKRLLIISLACLVLAGMANGVMDTLQFHFASQRVISQESLYWNPQKSWVLKYKLNEEGRPRRPLQAAFPGSTTFLVWTTDAYHGFNMLSRTTGSAGLTIPIWQGNGKKLKHYLLEVAGKGIIWTGGFHLTYTIIY